MEDNSNHNLQEYFVQEPDKKKWIFVEIVLGIIIIITIGLLIFFFMRPPLEEIGYKDLLWWSK